MGCRLTTAHLLRNHRNTGSLDSTTETGRDEELVEADKHIARVCVSRFNHDSLLHLDLRMDVIEISCCLEGTVPETEKGLVRVARAVFHQVPAWRLRAKPSTEDQRNSWYEG